MKYTCKKHPKYAVKRAPTSDCKTCWRIWLHAEYKDKP